MFHPKRIITQINALNTNSGTNSSKKYITCLTIITFIEDDKDEEYDDDEYDDYTPIIKEDKSGDNILINYNDFLYGMSKM